MSGGDFEAEMRLKLEHAARERTVPNMVILKSRQVGFTEAQRLQHRDAFKQAQGMSPHLVEAFRRGLIRQQRIRKLKARLWLAAPYLVLLAGLGCLSVSVWPQLLPTVGCVLFALSTVWSLVRCVRP